MREDRGQAYSRFLPWALPTGCLLLWFAVSQGGIAPSYLLPHPLDVGAAGYRYIFGTPGEAPYGGRFLKDAGASLIRVGAGFAIAVILGIPLGVVSGQVPAVQRLIGTSVNALRAVPGISWLPLAMVWFGIGIKTTLFLVALAAFFPIYLNAAAGAGQIDPLLIQSGAMMGIGQMRSIFAILLPGSMPHIFTGLRLGLGISWAYLVLGELSGVPDGIGAIIMDARMAGRIDMIVVGIIIIAVVGRLSDQMLKAFMRLCFKSVRRMP
jgi:NitT/TauT family transport system permease protein